jgi:hypothetical protein
MAFWRKEWRKIVLSNILEENLLKDFTYRFGINFM